jgi:hypothetical protein
MLLHPTDGGDETEARGILTRGFQLVKNVSHCDWAKA